MISLYSEDNLIEQPAIEIFLSLGYDYQNCYDEIFGTGAVGTCPTCVGQDEGQRIRNA